MRSAEERTLSLPGMELPARSIDPSTIRRYQPTQAAWDIYCAERGIDPYDADDRAVIAFLQARCGARVTLATVNITLTALCEVQRRALAAGHDVSVSYTRRARPRLDAWVRSYAQASPIKQCDALLLAQLARAVRSTLANDRPRGGVDPQRALYLSIRDAALLLIGWWGAMRADDLSHMTWGGCRLLDEGLEVNLEDSKTGACTIALTRAESVALCPVEAFQRLRTFTHTGHYDLRFVHNGHLFPGPRDVSRIVKRRCQVAGLVGHFTGHSMRPGFASECARQGVPDRLVRLHARWRRPEQHEAYIRRGRIWLDTPTRHVSLVGAT